MSVCLYYSIHLLLQNGTSLNDTVYFIALKHPLQNYTLGGASIFSLDPLLGVSGGISIDPVENPYLGYFLCKCPASPSPITSALNRTCFFILGFLNWLVTVCFKQLLKGCIFNVERSSYYCIYYLPVLIYYPLIFCPRIVSRNIVFLT
jgi:hypothetical protein